MGVKVAVIGIGNLILRDEGVGVHAIEALREGYAFPQGVSLIDGGTMGLDLLPYIEGNERLMLIDAVDFSQAPGHVEVMEGGDVKAFMDMKFSVHQIGVPDMLFAASFSGVMPPHICLVGIQPEVIEAGVELGPVLRGRLGALVETVLGKLGEWGVDVAAREGVR